MGEVYDEVLRFLADRRWWRDKSAGENSLKLQFKYQAGFELGMNDPCNFSDEAINNVVGIAKSGDRVADEALREIAAWLRSNEKSLPGALARYVDEGRPKRNRGPHPIKKVFRDDAVFHAVKLAVSRGLNPTRNREQLETESACSLVARVLSDLRDGSGRGEGAIEEIWYRVLEQRHRAGFRDQPSST